MRKNLNTLGIKWLSILLLPVLTASCGSLPLSETDGKGAILVPILLEIESKDKMFACSYIGLIFDNHELELKLPIEVQKIKKNRYLGYGLITNIKPGYYSSTKFRCYPYPETLINEKMADTFIGELKFNVEPNQVLVSQKALIGYQYGYEPSTLFNIIFDKIPFDTQKTTSAYFQKHPVPDGWTIKAQNNMYDLNE